MSEHTVFILNSELFCVRYRLVLIVVNFPFKEDNKYLTNCYNVIALVSKGEGTSPIITRLNVLFGVRRHIVPGGKAAS